jgi:phosphoglycolate phosphatase
MTRPVELIMFDLDGTLADTGPDLADAVNFTRARYDLAPLPAEQICTNVGRGVEYLIRKSLPIHGAKHFDEAIEIFVNRYEEHLLDQTVLYPGVHDVLDYYREKRRAVVTNKIHRLAEAVIRGLGLGDCFDLILGGDSAAHKKPHPALLTKVLERFRTPAPQALIVGDGDTDIVAGKRAGVMTCAVTYGLGNRGALIAVEPDLVIERLTELPDHFY